MTTLKLVMALRKTDADIRDDADTDNNDASIICNCQNGY